MKIGASKILSMALGKIETGSLEINSGSGLISWDGDKERKEDEGMVKARLIEGLRYWVSTRGDLLPRGHLMMSGNYSSCHNCGG